MAIMYNRRVIRFTFYNKVKRWGEYWIVTVITSSWFIIFIFIGDVYVYLSCDFKGYFVLLTFSNIFIILVACNDVIHCARTMWLKTIIQIVSTIIFCR